ncbi:MAG: DNA repair protein RadC [Myxococcota bacterium]|jgi:DNA repair protein RadC
MGPKSWPENERPREKLLRSGAQAMSDAELLALLLCTGVPGGMNVFELSMHLLARCGGLKGLDSAPIGEIRRVAGMGPAKAAVIKAAFEMGRRSMGAGDGQKVITGSAGIFELFRARCHNSDRERFFAAFLDSGLRLRGEMPVAVGGVDRCLVDVKLLLKDALLSGASSIAVVHNHPSGVCNPSIEDRRLTEGLENATETVGLRLLDHVIIAGAAYFSFADAGLIRRSAMLKAATAQVR